VRFTWSFDVNSFSSQFYLAWDNVVFVYQLQFQIYLAEQVHVKTNTKQKVDLYFHKLGMLKEYTSKSRKGRFRDRAGHIIHDPRSKCELHRPISANDVRLVLFPHVCISLNEDDILLKLLSILRVCLEPLRSSAELLELKELPLTFLEQPEPSFTCSGEHMLWGVERGGGSPNRLLVMRVVGFPPGRVTLKGTRSMR
jgi:hypothetical protein